MWTGLDRERLTPFEMWVLRRMEKISWEDRELTNKFFKKITKR